ncbi:MAG: hypothetical protein M1383_05240 [Patescibacteria group bacterium]|nr:hypothetical protein [Patescibacteria group bacterium]
MSQTTAATCPHCGNNPTPHLLAWYFESSNVLLTPLRRILMYNPLLGKVKQLLRHLNLSWQIVKILTFLRVIKLQKDPVKCKVRRAQVLWEEAEKRGLDMAEILFLGKPLDIYIAEKKRLVAAHGALEQKIKDKEFKIVFSGLPRPTGYDEKILDVMDDKVFLKKRFLQAGMPVPAGGTARTLRKAKKIFKEIRNSVSEDKGQESKGMPVIVKPRTGSRGRHTTTFVNSDAELEKAYAAAKQLCHWVVVEEQLFGPVYRATLINGKLRGVLRGDPPQMVGDGISSIKALIGIKNSLSHPKVKDIVIDDRMKLFLARQGLSLLSVPAAGQPVCLSEKIGVGYGGSSSEDMDICHPDNKELFEKAAAALGDPIIGFDFIIPDITQSWKGQCCGFIEANSLPFINLHHDPLLGNPRNVAAAVWDMMEEA